MVYDIIQWITVGVVIALAVAYAVRRIRRNMRDGECCSCELKDNCNKKKNNKKF